MKKLISVLLVLVISVATFAFAVDYLRVSNGEEAVFFSWGNNTETVGNETPVSESVTSDSSRIVQESTQKKDVVQINLYFSDEDFMGLKTERREFNNDEKLPLSIVSALISGPESESLYSLLPSDTRILSADISDDGVCTVDLSTEFCKFEGGSYMENMAVYSLVNSLCSHDKISKVKINIEGKKDALFGNHFSLEDVFEEDDSMLVS